MMVTLPKPNGGFRWAQPVDSAQGKPFDVAQGKRALVCDALEPFARHFFTTREWRLGDRTIESTDGWKDVALAASVGVDCLGRLQQVHGADAVTYKKGESIPGGTTPRADIALTDDPAVAVAVQTADCLPILIADRRTQAVAAAHAGWRGLAARVPLVAVERITKDLGTRVDDLLVAVGPAIGACCYEVGEDVRARFSHAGFRSAQIERWFRAEPARLVDNPPMRTLASTRRPDHWFFDGWSCVREQLESAGVPPDRIFIADLCTASHDAAFCSYRRDGPVAGRMAGVIRPGPSPR
jgi:purine-nucleoside/S-methyl-5'-thioadenosine phosphorylase / adenosine deaminase